MKKYLYTILISTTSLAAFSQAAQEVVKTERAFAAMALDSGTRKAFLHYLDKEGVVFNNGVISNGLQQWQSYPELKSKLLWQPSFAAISAAGDLGFTTGPYELRRTLNDTAVASGQFSTIWHKTEDGEWKFLADLGIDYRNPQFDQQPLTFADNFTISSDTSILDIENRFIVNYQKDSIKAFIKELHPKAWFNIDHQLPVHLPEAIPASLSRIPQQLTFKPVGSGISISRDLAYVYGIVQYNNRKENYLRVWAHTQQGWKILLQVLKW